MHSMGLISQSLNLCSCTFAEYVDQRIWSSHYELKRKKRNQIENSKTKIFEEIKNKNLKNNKRILNQKKNRNVK